MPNANASTAALLPMVFLDGAIPGVTPYCGGAPLWGGVLDKFSRETKVAVLSWAAMVDGAAEAGPSFDSARQQVADALRALRLGPCHLVAHDVAGLAALHLACDASDLVAAVTVCSSVAACPTGDGVENLTLAYPPGPPEARATQRWALERLSWSHLHIDDALLDACAETARSDAWQATAAKLRAAPSGAWQNSVSRAKSRLFERARGAGVPVPLQVVWGTHDPIAPLDQALWLYRVLAQSQARTQFHAINRAGALPFREEPDAFHQVVAAFNEGIASGA